jgi:hypothetical protein
MTNQFIPRSQRQARENQEAFERSKDKLQNINQSNKDFWEKKTSEDSAYLERINKQRGVV